MAAMILTPIALPDLPGLIAQFDHCLAGQPAARMAFRRIAATLELVEGHDLTLSEDPRHHAQAVALCRSFGMEVVDAEPRDAFTWDGRAVYRRMEPSVLIHEVGHLQVCAPERRHLLDFGLGAGPETGRKEEADQAMTVFGLERELEEALASLLGILWEAELGQPAILAFLEQNWLEGGASPHNRTHFLKIFGHLQHGGQIDAEGRPTRNLRHSPDEIFFAPLMTFNTPV